MSPNDYPDDIELGLEPEPDPNAPRCELCGEVVDLADRASWLTDDDLGGIHVLCAEQADEARIIRDEVLWEEELARRAESRRMAGWP